jgi:hypothetical protein
MMFKTVFVLALVAMAGNASAEICSASGPDCNDSFEKCYIYSAVPTCMDWSECNSQCGEKSCVENEDGNYTCVDYFKAFKKAAALGMGIIIAIIIGVLVGIGCCIFCCCYFVCATANKNNNQG